jgi:hypothetical protein
MPFFGRKKASAKDEVQEKSANPSAPKEEHQLETNQPTDGPNNEAPNKADAASNPSWLNVEAEDNNRNQETLAEYPVQNQESRTL